MSLQEGGANSSKSFVLLVSSLPVDGTLLGLLDILPTALLLELVKHVEFVDTVADEVVPSLSSTIKSIGILVLRHSMYLSQKLSQSSCTCKQGVKFNFRILKKSSKNS